MNLDQSLIGSKKEFKHYYHSDGGREVMMMMLMMMMMMMMISMGSNSRISFQKGVI